MEQRNNTLIPLSVLPSGQAMEVPDMGDFLLASMRVVDDNVSMEFEYEDQSIEINFIDVYAISGFMSPGNGYIDSIETREITDSQQSEQEIRKNFNQGSAYDLDNILRNLQSGTTELMQVRIIGISGVLLNILCKAAEMVKSSRVPPRLTAEEEAELKRRQEEIGRMLGAVMATDPTDQQDFLGKIRAAQKGRGKSKG